MQRFGRVLKLKAGAEKEYERQHAAVWPEVLAAIRKSGIRNYSIYRYGNLVFSFFELPDGLSIAEAGRVIASTKKCAEWEEFMHKLQAPLPESQPGSGSWWVDMPEIFHAD